MHTQAGRTLQRWLRTPSGQTLIALLIVMLLLQGWPLSVNAQSTTVPSMSSPAPLAPAGADLLPLGAPQLGDCVPDGDVNDDGQLTPADARLALQHFLGRSELDQCRQIRANVADPDAPDITPSDVVCLFQRFLARPSCLDNLDLPPVLAAIGDRTVVLGTTLTLQLTATDPNDDALTFAVALPFPDNARMVDASTGLFTFTPAADQVGTSELTFIVSDGMFLDAETITVTVEGPLPDGVTALSGRILDTNDFVQGIETPVVGATVSLLGTDATVLSDDSGAFMLDDIPAGAQVLDIESSTAAPAPDGSSYAGFRERISLIAAVTNVVERPFFLPRIDASSLTTVNPNDTTVVTNPELGVSLTIPANTARNPDGSNFTGVLSISEVPEGLAPAALPEELAPAMLLTMQPVGVTFAAPVQLTMPNLDNLPPGTELDLWSLNPDTGEFVVVGRGRVSADGSIIETIAGGIRAADWHFFLAQLLGLAASLFNNDNQDQSRCCHRDTGSRTAVGTGELTVEHTLASYRSLNVDRALRLVYGSLRADPQPIVDATTTIPAVAAVPLLISSRLSVAGLDQGAAIFTDTSTLDENADETIRQVRQFDASGLATGLYPFRLSLSSHYPNSTVTGVMNDEVLVHNQSNSALGAGWSLDGLGRLHVQDDGRLVLSEGDGSARVYRLAARGTGDFAAAPSFAVGGVAPQPEAVVVEDLNGDGHLDIATLSPGRPSVAGAGAVTLLFGDSTGAFAPPLQVPVETSGLATALAVGDVNDDGELDLIVGKTNNVVAIFLGQGEGTFGAETAFATGERPSSIAVDHVNGDSHLDLAVANRNSDTISILLGDGSGAFALAQTLDVGDQPHDVVAADFNRDARLDLAVANRNSDTISILLGDGAGDFAAAMPVEVGRSPQALAVGDFNRDTIPDLAVANTFGNTGSILLGDGSGVFTTMTLPVQTGPLDVAVGDWNEDGALDLAMVNDQSVNVGLFFGDGSGAFGPQISLSAGDDPFRVAVADVNADGHLDLVVANRDRGTVALLLGDGTGAFTDTPAFLTGVQTNRDLVSGDFDQDGRLDLVVAVASGVALLRGDGAGALGAPTRTNLGRTPFPGRRDDQRRRLP